MEHLIPARENFIYRWLYFHIKQLGLPLPISLAKSGWIFTQALWVEKKKRLSLPYISWRSPFSIYTKITINIIVCTNNSKKDQFLPSSVKYSLTQTFAQSASPSGQSAVQKNLQLSWAKLRSSLVMINYVVQQWL